MNDEYIKKVEYFKNGRISKIYYINYQGQLNGEYIEYRTDGEIWVHCFYKNDSKVGIYKQYDIYGELWHEYDHDKDLQREK